MFIEILYGILITLSLVIVPWLVAAPLSITLFVISLKNREVENLFGVLAGITMITPFLVVLFWAYYPLQTLLKVSWGPYMTSLGCISISVMILLTDILNYESKSIRYTYDKVAMTLSLNKKLYFMRIVLPLTLERSYYKILNLILSTLHITMLTSFIGVQDIFKVFQHLNTVYIKPVEIYTLMAILYLVLCLPIFLLSRDYKTR